MPFSFCRSSYTLSESLPIRKSLLIPTLGNITSIELYLVKMEPKDKKLTSFDGTGYVVEFIKKVSLHSALKGYDGKKQAQNLAGRFSGPAFEVYLRMSDDDQKDFSKIEKELLTEFRRSEQDREELIVELQNRQGQPDGPTDSSNWPTRPFLMMSEKPSQRNIL